MTKHQRLREMAEANEARAAEVADTLARGLMQPVAERPPGLAELAAELAALHAATQPLVQQLQRLHGREARGSQQRETRAMTGAQYVRLMRARLRCWRAVAQAAKDCTGGATWPLLPAARDRLDLGAAQEVLLAHAFTVTHRAVNPTPQAAEADAAGCFADIPTNAGRFMAFAHLALRLLSARKAPHPRRFVDVGCGGAVKLVIAAKLFDVADGIEYDAGYVEVARRTLAATRTFRGTIHHADGCTFDRYGDYDVIYFFWPMSREELMIAMERQITRNVRPGTVLIAPYADFLHRHRDYGCQHVAGQVYLAGMDTAAAAALAEAALRIGPHIPDPDAPVPIEAGWLRPLWLACLENGLRPDLDVPGY